MKRLAAAVGYALGGLQFAVRTQRTLRLHLGLAAGVGGLVVWLQLSAVETAVVVLALASVITAELLNTAVEALVDLLIERNHHELAKMAKDIAAGAVLVTAAGAAIAGVLLLGPPFGMRLGVRSDLATSGSRVIALCVGAVSVGGGGLAMWRSKREVRRS